MKTVVIFSGGMDSTILVYDLIARGDTVKVLSVDYGQRHAKEIVCAKGIAAQLGIEHRVADLRSITPLLAGSSLTSADIAVPEGHYAEDNMKATVVPNRNMIMLAVATGWAISMRFDAVAFGAHSGDHTIYPDCRPEFASLMDSAIRLADWNEVRLIRPFVGQTKAELAKRGAELKVPFERTWSCYKGGEFHCGVCGTCVERREAFHLAGLADPTTYDTKAPTVAMMVRDNWRITA
ncbi:7-cyano-7-deazaguanine synthase [Lacunisphaera limnophila]|uniref:7-cyano-7-deazaguanine synthase n=1 Tax=Lacunisphaera limnophila TaxID=1838286 RepID=A0A1D8AZ02_9BACT|nr:7-cyano-7-deazaguanine synthase QueC [Lacunisphaera limnophila]AOS46105.1 7-cyano-7-deazaguanine synthase [Lacunisphaera limnophila]